MRDRASGQTRLGSNENYTRNYSSMLRGETSCVWGQRSSASTEDPCHVAARALRQVTGDDDEIDESVFDEDVEISDADFDGDTFKSRTLKSWAETPPMTQAYVGASLALTCGSFLAFNNQWPEWLHLNWGAVFKRAQVWCVFSASFSCFLLLPGCEDQLYAAPV